MWKILICRDVARYVSTENAVFLLLRRFFKQNRFNDWCAIAEVAIKLLHNLSFLVYYKSSCNTHFVL